MSNTPDPERDSSRSRRARTSGVSNRPTPDDAVNAATDASALAHELRGLIDGSQRYIGLARRSLAGASTARAQKVEDADRQLSSAAAALERMSALVTSSLTSALAVGASNGSVTLKDAIEHACETVLLETDISAAAFKLEFHGTVGSRPSGVLYTPLVNVLRNAAQACRLRQGGAAPSIIVEARIVGRGAGSRIRVIISDNGPGVAARRKSKRAGHGMGLDMCREVLASVGGSLALTSSPRGADCTIEVPAVDQMAKRIGRARSA